MWSDEGHVDFADDADLDLFGLGISQISEDFADNLQNFCFFLGGFEEKAYFCGKVERLKGEDYEYGCFK